MLYALFLGGVYFFFFLVFFASPLIGKLLLFAVNCILPDPIFAIDEVIMVATTIHHLYTWGERIRFMWEHKILSLILLTLTIIGAYHIYLYIL